MGSLLHFARQRSEGGAYRQTRVEAGFTVNSRAAKSTLASITWCVYCEVCGFCEEIIECREVKDSVVFIENSATHVIGTMFEFIIE